MRTCSAAIEAGLHFARDELWAARSSITKAEKALETAKAVSAAIMITRATAEIAGAFLDEYPMPIDKLKEDRVRRLARRNGCEIRKSRQWKHVPNLDNYGEYMLIDI